VVGIADVVGHGIDAALLMASMHARFRTLAELSLGIDQIARRINAALIQPSAEAPFMTGIMLRIDPRARTLIYASAGHPPGFILGKTGALKGSLDSLSIPLGIEASAEYPLGGPIPLDPGDLVVLYTDGAYEARSPEGIMFGIERLLQVIRDSIDLPSENILMALNDAIHDFINPEALSDDVTVVLVNIN
jgi:sigma-B regulation protein RsbU (phosphoserine phosphatase)